MADETKDVRVMSSAELLQHWQGHRRVTRKTIQLFPEGTLFVFSVGGMRPFGAMMCEVLGLTMPTVDGVLTGAWEAFAVPEVHTKARLLQLWDEQTAALEAAFPRLTEERFQATQKAFGMWEGTGWQLIQYAIDNEIHHRAEGFVYLRKQGIAPPVFYDRS